MMTSDGPTHTALSATAASSLQAPWALRTQSMTGVPWITSISLNASQYQTDLPATASCRGAARSVDDSDTLTSTSGNPSA